jgi:hypothetical protein
MTTARYVLKQASTLSLYGNLGGHRDHNSNLKSVILKHTTFWKFQIVTKIGLC